jgi:DNA-binding transcriptional LysR family regulator
VLDGLFSISLLIAVPIAVRPFTAPYPPVGIVAMKLTTRPPVGFNASTHALIAAAPHGKPCRPLANISGICFNTATMSSLFASKGTAKPLGKGAYGSSTSGTTRCLVVVVPEAFSLPPLPGNLKK